MRAQDSSSSQENQFSIDASTFISDFIPGTGIRLLRARPACQAELAKQLSIPLRLELLRRQAPRQSPVPRLLQDDAEVGVTSTGEIVRLVLTVVTELEQWTGNWFVAVLPPSEIEAWKTYLAATREMIVLEARCSERRP
jgi:hypothetical protein